MADEEGAEIERRELTVSDKENYEDIQAAVHQLLSAEVQAWYSEIDKKRKNSAYCMWSVGDIPLVDWHLKSEMQAGPWAGELAGNSKIRNAYSRTVFTGWSWESADDRKTSR